MYLCFAIYGSDVLWQTEQFDASGWLLHFFVPFLSFIECKICSLAQYKLWNTDLKKRISTAPTFTAMSSIKCFYFKRNYYYYDVYAEFNSSSTLNNCDSHHRERRQWMKGKLACVRRLPHGIKCTFFLWLTPAVTLVTLASSMFLLSQREGCWVLCFSMGMPVGLWFIF